MSNKKRERDDTSGRLDDAHSYDVDYNQRIIYLMGIEQDPPEEHYEPGIEYRIANRFVRNINFLSSIDPEKPILICMKSNGGYVEEGMAIYDAIKAAPMPVTILNYTHARSMTSLIFQAANKRVMMPHSTFMFHQGTIGLGGTAKQVYSTIDFDKRFHDEIMYDIYVSAMKGSSHGKARTWTPEKIRKWLTDQMDKKEDVYLTAEEAVEWGFADEIFSGWPGLVTSFTPEQLARK